jgi:hypothetical protein
VAVHGGGTVRSADSPASPLDLAKAHIHALEGHPNEAFALLASAVGGGVRTGYDLGLLEFPAFDPYRSFPQYRTIDARLKALIAAERAEVLRMRQQRRAA